MSKQFERLAAALADSYTIERELPGGGMARVFLAEEVRLQRHVVIKMLSLQNAGELSAERFAREIAFVAALQQANIVPVITSGDVDGVAWYSMPYIDGESLKARLAGAPVELAEAIGILRDVARALAYAHARGIVHRDIKPDNILLSGGTAVVTDFGIAKAVDASRTHADDTLTSAGTSLGTPAYMAPEQAAGDPVDSRADLYSWGVVAYEMLSGAHPFAGKTTAQALIAAHLIEDPEPLVGIAGAAPDLAALVLRCMAKNADDRPASATELLPVLDTFSTGGTAARAARAASRELVSPAEPTAPSVRRLSRQMRGVLVAAIIVAAAGGLWFARGKIVSPSGGGARSSSLVVLPFENMSGAPDGEVFADGITEDVITRLATIGGLDVISRTSAMVYKKHDKTIKQIAAELNVGAVLEGSVRRDGSHVRVVAQLIDAATDHHLWDATFDRELADVFALQSELAERIAGSLKATLSPAARQSLATQPTRDTLAYQLYLQGLAAYNERAVESTQRSIALMQEAVRRDSTFSLAWLGMADGYLKLPFQRTTEGNDAVAMGRAAVERALAIDPNLGEAHATRGWMLMVYDYDWKNAERELARAVALSPSSSRVLVYYSELLVLTGRIDEGLAAGERARTVDPLAPDPIGSLGGMQQIARRYDAALVTLHKATDAQPNNPQAWATRLNAAVNSGHDDDAIESAAGYLRTVNASSPTVAEMQAARTTGGHSALVRLMLAKFPPAEVIRFSPQWYADLGERDLAMNALENAYQSRLAGLLFIVRYKPFDSMRTDPRFVAFMHRIGLEP